MKETKIKCKENNRNCISSCSSEDNKNVNGAGRVRKDEKCRRIKVKCVKVSRNVCGQKRLSDAKTCETCCAKRSRNKKEAGKRNEPESACGTTAVSKSQCAKEPCKCRVETESDVQSCKGVNRKIRRESGRCSECELRRENNFRKKSEVRKTRLTDLLKPTDITQESKNPERNVSEWFLKKTINHPVDKIDARKLEQDSTEKEINNRDGTEKDVKTPLEIDGDPNGRSVLPVKEIYPGIERVKLVEYKPHSPNDDFDFNHRNSDIKIDPEKETVKREDVKSSFPNSDSKSTLELNDKPRVSKRSSSGEIEPRIETNIRKASEPETIIRIQNVTDTGNGSSSTDDWSDTGSTSGGVCKNEFCRKIEPGADVNKDIVSKDIPCCMCQPGLDDSSFISYELGPVTTECCNKCMEKLGKRLLRATQEGKSMEVRKILDEGVDPDFTLDSEWTALHRAASKGFPDVVAELIKSGADVHLKIRDYTALHLAAYNDRTGRCVFLLINAGADLESVNKHGRTPLHYASESGNVSAVRELLAAGADRMVKDSRGWTPIDVGKTSEIRRILHQTELR